MITFENVTKKYPDGTVAVDDLTLEVPEGTLAVFVGPSGCGKTTSMRMINRMIDPTSGTLTVDGKDVTKVDPVKLRLGIGYVIQSAGLMPHQRVIDNVATVPVLRGESRRSARKAAYGVLERVGLDPKLANRYPAQLSGGQQQRVGVARALAADPPILLMDEPFSAVDPVVREDLQTEILRLQSELRKTIVFVTHDIDEAIKLGDRVAVFGRGGVLQQYDEPSRLLSNPANGLPGALVAAGQGGYGRSFPPRWTKVEPGITLAWSVLGDNNTVLRLSYNRFYNQPQVFNGHFGTQAFNGSQLYLSSNVQLEPALILAQGLRPSRFPDLRPEAANGTSAQVMDVSGAQPTSQTFQIRLQRQLAKNLILSVNYNRNYGKNQFANNNLSNPNAINPINLKYRDQLNTLSFANSLRPFPQFQDFDVAQSFALGRHLNRNFSVQVEKRTQGGLALTVGYSNFRRWDNYSSPVQNMYDRNSEWALSGFSQPHQLDITYLYELPFGPGKHFLSSGMVGKHILGGWALSGTGSYFSGQPLRLQPMFNNTGGVIQQNHLYVNEVPGVDPHVQNQSPRLWFNPAAFVNPDNFSLGTGPRIHPSLLSPGGYNHDMTLNKRMAVGGDRTLEFTATLLNATNHANWNNPDTRIGTLATPNYNAGRIIGSSGGRIVQLGLRLNF